MKTWRQKKILEIIQEQDISTQDGLAKALETAGFPATQATISRDIRELGLFKIPGGSGLSRYAAAGSAVNPGHQERLKRFFKESVLAIDYSENLVVIKTRPGEAQGVASAIDHVDWPEIIGTVAGDDTILVVVKPKKIIHAVMKKFISLSGR